MNKIAINKLRTIKYVASEFTEGLTDLILTARKPDGTPFEFEVGVTELTLTETADGVYEGSYTPDAQGIWTEKVSSATNGDKAIGSVKVVSLDTEDVGGKVDTVEGKVDTANSKLDTVDLKADGIKTDTESIETKIDDLDTQIKPGGYFAN